jgi:tRNA pseudouridine38-40 synthase
VTRIALGIVYDGQAWQGWQTQPHGQTVQDCVEAALSKFTAQPVATVCAGRTDTGVHALNQVIHLDTDAIRTEESWVRGTNAHLPPSVAIQWARHVPDAFHARFSAVARSYTYVILNTRVRHPLWDGRVGWVHQSLDVAAMQAAAKDLLGEHDFSSFRSSQCQAKSPVRTMQRVAITVQGSKIVVQLTANAFLHHMVRNIMGALVQVGQGRQSVNYVSELLLARDRTLGAPTFSAQGLYLTDVEYPNYDFPRPNTEGFSLDSINFEDRP